jgi:hypothetical protein
MPQTTLLRQASRYKDPNETEAHASNPQTRRKKSSWSARVQGFRYLFDNERWNVTGFTRSANFPTTPVTFDRTFNGADDAFTAKLKASGSAFAYSTFLGGSGLAGGDDDGSGIAVDTNGEIYVTGGTTSANFPTTPGAFDRTLNGGSDVFVTKLLAPRAAARLLQGAGAPPATVARK